MLGLEIHRIYQTEELTLGIFFLNEKPSFISLELPWKNNESQVSCIPIGEYLCVRRKASANITADIGEAFEIKSVPNRSDILIHVANYPKEIKGCVAIGMRWGWNLEGVFDSKLAFKSLMKTLQGINECTIKINSRR